jgi:hypothetical protein
MRPLKLSALVFCFVMIGILPQDSGYEHNQPFPLTISGAVSANIGFIDMAVEPNVSEINKVLTEGRVLFETQCTSCHSSQLIWKSGTLSQEADSSVTRMLAKSGANLSSPKVRLLAEYLQYKLPSQ